MASISDRLGNALRCRIRRTYAGLLVAATIIALAGCASSAARQAEQRACIERCEYKFAHNLADCNEFNKFETNPRIRERLLLTCLKGEGWPDGQQDCERRCAR